MKYRTGMEGKFVVQLRLGKRLVRRFELNIDDPPTFEFQRVLNQRCSLGGSKDETGQAEDKEGENFLQCVFRTFASGASKGASDCYDRGI